METRRLMRMPWQAPAPYEADDGPSLVGVRLASSEWERRTARLERDELASEPSGLVEWRYAPARVLWTTDPPVTPGLYFCKLLGGSTRVVDVYADDRGRLLASWSDIDEFSVGRPGMLWSDHPIQEPE